ncbi:MAG: M64 family metallopeptidase [Alistipes sp.]|nr:M64 family metallopeptidase [Alistipes sp.]
MFTSEWSGFLRVDYIGGDNTKCLNYASHIEGMSDARMNNVGVIVILNSARHSGTCHMYYGIPGDYAIGPSVSYFSCGTSPEQTAELLHHEAGGHGFAKLADEYQYDAPIPQEQITYYQTIYANYGLYKNVDFTTDPKTVKWSRFLSDSRYAAEELGIYEGACTYATGAYRPTENSIMRYGTGEFNAPSREAIYYRLFKLANGATWQYDYEAFVKWDQTRQRPTQSKAAALLQQPLSTTPPVLYKGYWRNGALRLE